MKARRKPGPEDPGPDIIPQFACLLLDQVRVPPQHAGDGRTRGVHVVRGFLVLEMLLDSHIPILFRRLLRIRARRREKAEEEHEASSRSRNTVTILLEAKAIEPGTELKLNLNQFSPEERTTIGPAVQNNPDMGLAEWTGLGLRKAIRWRMDGKDYSATGLVKHILSLHGCDIHPLPGPRYWRVPEGKTLSGLASILSENPSDE